MLAQGHAAGHVRKVHAILAAAPGDQRVREGPAPHPVPTRPPQSGAHVRTPSRMRSRERIRPLCAGLYGSHRELPAAPGRRPGVPRDQGTATGRASSFTPELTAALRVHQVAQARERLAVGSCCHDHDLVFCQPDGSPIDPRHDWAEWGQILREVGLEHSRAHAMRHSAATIALAAVPLPVVQEMLGRSDIRAARSYTHVFSPPAEDAAERMGRVLLAPDLPTVPKNVPNGV